MRKALSLATGLLFALCLLAAVGAAAVEESTPVETTPTEAQPQQPLAPPLKAEILESAETPSLCDLLPAPTLPTPTLKDHHAPIGSCAQCGSYCISDDACYGLNYGDICSNDGKTCQAFSGCALYNCCRCR